MMNSTMPVANRASRWRPGGVAQLQGDVAGQGAHRVQDRGGHLQGVARHHDHRHGLADGPAHPQDDRGDDAGRGRGQHHPAHRLPVGWPPGRWSRPGRGLGTALRASMEMLMTVGRIMMPRMMGRGQERQSGAAQVIADQRHQPDYPQKAVNHRRDARQELKGGLQDESSGAGGRIPPGRWRRLRPRGTPMTMAPRVTSTEEMIMARMPKWPLVGAQWLEAGNSSGRQSR